MGVGVNFRVGTGVYVRSSSDSRCWGRDDVEVLGRLLGALGFGSKT